MSIEIKTYRSPIDDRITLAATVSSMELIESYAAKVLIDRIVDLIAQRYVEENYPQVVAKLDQQAIANLVIAESGKKIAEEIRLTPPKPEIVEKMKVYQRGLFGGIKRIG